MWGGGVMFVLPTPGIVPSVKSLLSRMRSGTIPSTVRTSFSSKLTSSSMSGPEIPLTDLSPFKSGEPTVHLYSDCSMMALMVAMFST